MAYGPEPKRRRSLRLPGYDYAQAGAYFVTIVTQERLCLFGEAVKGEMILSPAGHMVQSRWEELAERFPFVGLDAFVVMPNHVHGIIGLTSVAGSGGEYKIRPYESVSPGRGEGRTPVGTVAGSLGRVVQAFKSHTTHTYLKTGVQQYRWPAFPGRLWQRNYYEHVIRNDVDLARIRQYIAENPARWAEDKENPQRDSKAPSS